MSQSKKQIMQRTWRQQYGMLKANKVTLSTIAGRYLCSPEFNELMRIIDKVIDLHNANYKQGGLNIPTEEERRQRLHNQPSRKAKNKRRGKKENN
jgi:pyrrolidone-carboxylate peptidase